AKQPLRRPALNISAQGPALDARRAPGHVPLVVDVEAAPAVRDRPVVHERYAGRGDALPHPPGKGRSALAVEVALEPVAHRFVEEDPRPARSEDDRHRPGRGGLRPQQRDRHTRGLAGEVLRRTVLEELRALPSAAPGAALAAHAVPRRDDRAAYGGPLLRRPAADAAGVGAPRR